MATNGHAKASVNEDIKIERELPVELTEVELLERGERMSQCELAIEALKSERKHVNAKISQQVEQRAELAHTIDTGLEPRTVICKWISSFETNNWSLVRQDTGAEVESRAMTAADRQGAMQFPTDDPPAIGDVEELEDVGGGFVSQTELEDVALEAAEEVEVEGGTLNAFEADRASKRKRTSKPTAAAKKTKAVKTKPAPKKKANARRAYA